MGNHSNNKRTKKTILICDDELDVLTSFELILKPKYNLVMVDSGEKCVEKFIEEIDRGNKIDLVLLDYRLYDMMGDSVARKIKEYSETKIILISAYYVDDSDSHISLSSASNSYLQLVKSHFHNISHESYTLHFCISNLLSATIYETIPI